MCLLAQNPSSVSADGNASGHQDPPGTALTFNLSSTDPVAVYAAQEIGETLARSNATGGLPPWEELLALVEKSNPDSVSLLATLPVSLPFPAEGEARLTTLAALNATQIFQAVTVVDTLSAQFLATPALGVDDSTRSGALDGVGTELQSIGHTLTAWGSQVQVNEARRLIASQEAKARAEAPDPPRPFIVLVRFAPGILTAEGQKNAPASGRGQVHKGGAGVRWGIRDWR